MLTAPSGFTRFQPADARHTQVEKQDVGLFLLPEPHRSVTVGRLADDPEHRIAQGDCRRAGRGKANGLNEIAGRD